MTPSRTYMTEIDGETCAVEVSRIDGGQYLIRVGDTEQTYDVRRLGDSVISLLHNGQHAEASIITDGDTYDVLVSGTRSQITLTPEHKARRSRWAGKASTGGRQEICASMPGKVVEVLVSVGDTVEPNQGVLVVEAMKMENEIKANGPGEVKSIHVEPGQAVEPGALLAIIE